MRDEGTSQGPASCRLSPGVMHTAGVLEHPPQQGMGEWGTVGTLRVSYPPCGWLLGTWLACHCCRGSCKDEHRAMSRTSSEVQPPGPPMRHSAVVPERTRRVGRRGFYQGSVGKGGCCISPTLGALQAGDGHWGVSGGELLTSNGHSNAKAFLGCGVNSRQGMHPCASMRVHGGDRGACLCMCAQGHTGVPTHVGMHVCAPRSCKASSLSVNAQGPDGHADGGAPLGAL